MSRSVFLIGSKKAICWSRAIADFLLRSWSLDFVLAVAVSLSVKLSVIFATRAQ